MKKVTWGMALIGLIALSSCESESVETAELNAVDAKANLASGLVFDMEGCSGSVRDLVAGQHNIIGTVTVTEEGGFYNIKYEVTNEDWCITGWQIDVEQSPSDFPVTQSGNPKVGNFEFKGSESCSKVVEYQVATSEGTWIAAHADVVCSTGSKEAILANLPETVDFCAIGQGPDAYINIESEGDPLTGSFGAWCVDNDIDIGPGCYEDAAVLNSMGVLPAGLFEKPENFDLINWLLNENEAGNIVGAESPNGFGVYTYGDLQFAIGNLIDIVEDPTGAAYSLGAFSPDRVAELIALAEANGEGFNPDCGDYIGIILIAEGVQPLIIPFPLECSDCGETAWADGCSFPGSNWAMYFQYSN